METQQKFLGIIEDLNAMALNNVDLYLQYAKVKNMIKVLVERSDELSGLILEEMLANKEEKKKFEFASFTVGKRKSYEYTEEVKKLEDSVKSQKAKEVEEGLATVKETNYLLMK